MQEAPATKGDIDRVMERLDSILAAVQGSTSSAEELEKAKLCAKLDKLTLKRHAVLTATLGGQSYQAIADLMKVNVTTVKLHLRSTLQVLEIPTRQRLLVEYKGMLDIIPEEEYRRRYGISKSWHLVNDPLLLAVLHHVKPASNQYIQGNQT